MRDYLWMLPSSRVAQRGDELFVVDGNETLRCKTDGIPIGRLVEILNGENEEHRVRALLDDDGLFEVLDRSQLLVRLTRPLSELCADLPTRSRQLSYFAHLQLDHPDSVFAELAARHVLLVGVGGVGSHVALALAGSGVRHMTLIDPDTIEESNLNRQILYTREDLGRPKVSVAAAFLSARHADLEIRVRQTMLDAEITREDWFSDVDLIIFAGDSPTIDDEIASSIGVKPVLVGGYSKLAGHVGPLCAPELGTGCFPCLYATRDREAQGVIRESPRQQRGWQPSAITINGLVGSLLGEVAIRFLAPSLSASAVATESLEFDMRNLECNFIETPGCPHAERARDVTA